MLRRGIRLACRTLSALALLVVASATAGDLPYAEFVRRNRGHGHQVSQQRVDAELAETMAQPPPAGLGLSPDQLRARVVEALRIGFLLDGISTRPLTATVRSHSEEPRFTRKEVVLTDELLGPLEVTVLLPRDGLAPLPAIVGLHGHGDHPPDFVRRYMGAELASAGYVVVLPWTRALTCDAEEETVSLDLLRTGLTLMGLHVYEALLATRYLRDLPEVDPHRIAILGHSGGSSTANLVVRVTDWLVAQVSDHEIDYRDLCDGRVHCETVPALFALSTDINDERGLAIPRLHVPYGFEDPPTHRLVLRFLALSLHHRPTAAP